MGSFLHNYYRNITYTDEEKIAFKKNHLVPCNLPNGFYPQKILAGYIITVRIVYRFSSLETLNPIPPI